MIDWLIDWLIDLEGGQKRESLHGNGLEIKNLIPADLHCWGSMYYVTLTLTVQACSRWSVSDDAPQPTTSRNVVPMNSDMTARQKLTRRTSSWLRPIAMRCHALLFFRLNLVLFCVSNKQSAIEPKGTPFSHLQFMAHIVPSYHIITML